MTCDPLAVLAEFDRLASRSLWPGFNPRRVPVVLYGGNRTLLYRHPNPPPEFTELHDRQGLYAFPGQHPAMRANTSIELGGVQTATLILKEERSTIELAAVLIHEAFHVFQRERHPNWSANEVELFTYPIEDIELLQLCQLEMEALRRALKASKTEVAAVWAATALELRRKRFSKMSEGSVAYERGTELFEGLAQYIEALAVGMPQGLVIIGRDFAADEIRSRCYATGQALALLLDRFDPAWKDKLEVGLAWFLDELLTAMLRQMGVQPARFLRPEEEIALSQANKDVQDMQAKRTALREDFLSQPGWQVIVIANEKEPLWPQGFDPMNVHRLGGGEVLHTRWLKLKNSVVTLEVLNKRCLTEAAGAHPLFDGVRRVAITGITPELTVKEKDDEISVSAEGLSIESRMGRIERLSEYIIILYL